jgi:hypothetical protein
MHTRYTVAAALAIALAVFPAVGCGGVTDPSQNIVETFSNTVPVGGSAFNSLKISRSGEFAVTLVSLSPPVSVFVSVTWGAVISGTCQAVVPPNNFSTPGHLVLNGPVSQQGTYCVMVADLGFFTVPETYTVQVSHP